VSLILSAREVVGGLGGGGGGASALLSFLHAVKRKVAAVHATTQLNFAFIIMGRIILVCLKLAKTLLKTNYTTLLTCYKAFSFPFYQLVFPNKLEGQYLPLKQTIIDSLWLQQATKTQ
jgi:hypothetical protein